MEEKDVASFRSWENPFLDIKMLTLDFLRTEVEQGSARQQL